MRWYKIIGLLLIITFSISPFANAAAVRFIDRTSSRLRFSFARAGDVDGDGDLDLFVCHHQVSGLLLNNGKGEFAQKIPLTTIEEEYDARRADFVDLDNDGDLDVFVYCFKHVGERDILFINDGHGTLTNESEERLPEYHGTCSGIADVDSDGDLDIICPPRSLLVNDGTGRFTDEGGARLPNLNAQALAIALGDVNSNSHVDIFLANWGAQNQLLLNDGTGHFSDETAFSLPQSKSMSRQVKLADIDRDKDLDVLVCNDKSPTVLINDGAGVFTDETDKWLPPIFKGVNIDIDFGDVNDDGVLDLVILPRDSIRLLINRNGKFVDITKSALPAIFSVEHSASFGGAFRSIQLVDISKWSKVLSTFEPVSGDWLVVSGDSPITVSSVNKRA